MKNTAYTRTHPQSREGRKIAQEILFLKGTGVENKFIRKNGRYLTPIKGVKGAREREHEKPGHKLASFTPRQLFSFFLSDLTARLDWPERTYVRTASFLPNKGWKYDWRDFPQPQSNFLLLSEF